MALSLCTTYGIQNKTGEFSSMRKMLLFCCFPFPPTILPKWELGSEAFNRDGMHLQSYEAKLGEQEETYLITLPISSLSYLHYGLIWVSWIQQNHSHRLLYTLNFTVSSLLCLKMMKNENTSCLGRNRMVPACTEHSSVWPCLNHRCGFSSLEDDKGQEDRREHWLPSLFNLWLINILQLCLY